MTTNSLENIRTFTQIADTDFAICDTTGLVYATQTAVSRILEIPENTLRRHLKIDRHLAENQESPTATNLAIRAIFLTEECGLQPVDGKLKLSTGKASSARHFYSGEQIYLIASVVRKDLAKQMRVAGSQVYLSGCAGIKIGVAREVLRDYAGCLNWL